jgi:hypothetical protein
MLKNIAVTALVAAFGLAFVFGSSHTVQAAPADGTVTISAADLDGLYLGAEPQHRRPGRGGQPNACMAAGKAIHAACPCEGIADAAGIVQPWGSHGAFMECVNAKIAELGAGENPPPAECLTRIAEHLDTKAQGELKIGDEGFVCKPDCPRGGPRGPRKPGGGN